MRAVESPLRLIPGIRIMVDKIAGAKKAASKRCKVCFEIASLRGEGFFKEEKL